jgi:hypothetical protein
MAIIRTKSADYIISAQQKGGLQLTQFSQLCQYCRVGYTEINPGQFQSAPTSRHRKTLMWQNE